ncbi:hypothetical protein GC197_09990 [bacterium]|nr:hypothetical protein [bacterium]
MKLIQRGVVGSGIHRSGWPCVMQAMREVATGNGVLLDDFADASFSYQPIKEARLEPWVGVFHHPVKVASPLGGDTKHELRSIDKHRFWETSRPTLRGAVALCEEVAADLRDWLDVPTLSIWHPTETDVPRWNAEVALENRRLVQAGFCLRNTQLIFQMQAPGWQRMQLFGASPWYRSRDEALQKTCARPDVDRDQVEVIRRLDNTAYDRLLAESVLVTELYGAAANNLIVECMARGTPILVNQLPAIEEYLGVDYPLFYTEVEQIHTLLEPSRLRAANTHLLERAQLLPTFKMFAERIRAFTDSLEAA